jgi:5-methylcytosine-specific restriction endonuclease McrA
VKVQGHCRPDDGDWLYWSTRQGRHPNVGPRLATLLKAQRGRCRDCGLFFQPEDQIEIDHSSGDRHDTRLANRQALHGHCHDAKTREHGDDLPRRMRAKHRDTEERGERKPSRPFWNSGRRSDPPLDCNQQVLIALAPGALNRFMPDLQPGTDGFEIVGSASASTASSREDSDPRALESSGAIGPFSRG